METKKNPKADLTRKTSFFFSIALLITMSFVLFAFELKQYATPIDEIVQGNTDNFDDFEVPLTNIIPPQPPVRVPTIIVEVAEDEEIESQISIDIELPQETSAPPVVVAVDEPEIPSEEPFVFVEDPATPVGGMAAFYRYVSENINYPAPARRMDTEGKVFVEFVVNRDGSLVDVVAIKGIGSGCDEEAVRVIRSAPKWNPGKQRGKPVRQKLVVPVIFTLGR